MEKNWLEGKVISCLGDSITQGVGNNDVSWAHYLQDILPVKRINNYGIAGTRITKGTGWDQPFVDRYDQMDPESDIIIVYGGINDCNHALPIGTIDSYDVETFYGETMVRNYNDVLNAASGEDPTDPPEEEIATFY